MCIQAIPKRTEVLTEAGISAQISFGVIWAKLQALRSQSYETANLVLSTNFVKLAQVRSESVESTKLIISAYIVLRPAL